MARIFTLKNWEKLRSLAYSGTADTQLFLDLGHFIARFAMAELNLTRPLAMLTEQHNLAGFDLLVKGIDARVKVERIRKAAAQRGLADPAFSERLDVFEGEIIVLRNRLTHSSMALAKRAAGCTISSSARERAMGR